MTEETKKDVPQATPTNTQPNVDVKAEEKK
jgi:hypothetical protein